MAQAFFQFSPGDCRNACFCNRCQCESPYTWDVTILGTTYTLTRSRLLFNGQVSSTKCHWLLDESAAFDCGTKRYIDLFLRVGDFLLTVRDADGATMRRYKKTVSLPVDCLTAHTLADDTLAGHLCAADGLAATIAPGAVKGCCGDCACEGSSVLTNCECCPAGVPFFVDVELPGGWTNGPECGACNIAGVYTLEFEPHFSLNECRWLYHEEDHCNGHDLQIWLSRFETLSDRNGCNWWVVHACIRPGNCSSCVTYELNVPADDPCDLTALLTLTKAATGDAHHCMAETCDGTSGNTCTIQAVP